VSVSHSRSKAFRSAGVGKAGLQFHSDDRPASDGSTPTWDSVEQLVALLARTRSTFASTLSDANWISAYEPGRRLMLEAGTRSSWVQMEHVRACWETFERRGRICRRDVLEPGRHSAFMMALFAQVRGVREEAGEEPSLVLRSTSPRTRAAREK
jgi:hypothetical protein